MKGRVHAGDNIARCVCVLGVGGGGEGSKRGGITKRG